MLRFWRRVAAARNLGGKGEGSVAERPRGCVQMNSERSILKRENCVIDCEKRTLPDGWRWLLRGIPRRQSDRIAGQDGALATNPLP